MGRKIFFLLAIALLIGPNKARAEEFHIKITAVVPVSDYWANAISNNSEIKQRKTNEDYYFDVSAKGPKFEQLKNQKFLMEVFFNGNLLKKETSEGRFKITPKEIGKYEIVFNDVTWERKVKLNKTIKFSNGSWLSKKFQFLGV